ncbi:putative AsnC-family transcriptional regulator [Actinoplanes missouriensis 431]|uniref:Putative AsnC-family transcriptional regulator n=1 Tax=Actinoplanes missouriensis (strain ATCC 14538 / DSM 43046 / CBS 188.64 / JCM 3121 / NBRC 102363 / NCIMB 12654 / NRRL B-3342 / UNCC 431) TaxID=512565 RepID=I0H6P1_ACTM4|nr:Lrp/AsnC family transcriptional regulator [Actinoplanes missouriensis]BAL88678.1 putative AsnC-family transcriptional regulator [Actinoplanes missouriensis 431]
MEIDVLDRQVIYALRINGRAGYREIGAVLGVSDQTVARRYRRLRAEAGLRVVALPNPLTLGQEMWTIRLRTAPDAAVKIAEALARRRDTVWVSLTSGGTEISCSVRVPAAADWESLLLEKLPRTPRLVSVTAHCLIHQFAGGATGADRRDQPLTAEQITALTPDWQPAPTAPTGAARLTSADDRLIDALARDGRMGYTELAAATGWPESTVRRRLRDLLHAGALFCDVEIDPDALGYRGRVMLWLSVAPSRLAAAGAALASHEEIVFAAATTGPTNLNATVVCRDMAEFYRYLTEKIGSLDGVERVESAPLLRHVKQVGAIS